MFGNKDNDRRCCTGGSACCGSVPAKSAASPAEKRRLDIDFLYLDLDVCARCQETGNSLDKALAEAAHVLEAAGIEVTVSKIHIQDEEQARAHRFLSSPTIRINGRDIQLDVRESLCESCGDLCGEDVDCRVWVYQGKEYTSPPKAMILDAILRAAYGGQADGDNEQPDDYEVPANLRRFFAATRTKHARENL